MKSRLLQRILAVGMVITMLSGDTFAVGAEALSTPETESEIIVETELEDVSDGDVVIEDLLDEMNIDMEDVDVSDGDVSCGDVSDGDVSCGDVSDGDVSCGDVSGSDAQIVTEIIEESIDMADLEALELIEPGNCENYTDAGPIALNSFNVEGTAALLAGMVPEEKEPALILKKEASRNDDDTYNIQLEAFATGTIKDTEVNVPVDVVLVLDQSGSMRKPFNNASYHAVSGELDPEGTYYIRFSYGGYQELACNKIVTRSYIPAEGELDESATYYIQTEEGWAEVSYKEDGWYDESDVLVENADFYSAEDSTDIKWQYLDGENVVTVPANTQFYTNEDGDTETRLDALKRSAEAFVRQIAYNATHDSKGNELPADERVDHRVAMVGFARGISNEPYFLNTEIFIGKREISYGDPAVLTEAGNAFQNLSTEEGLNNMLDSIDLLDANGATRTDLGLQLANLIYANDTVDKSEIRNRVVVLITDGMPNDFNGWNDYTADATVTQASYLKAPYEAEASLTSGKGATLYAIAADIDGTDPDQIIYNSGYGRVNRVMNAISSNYPNAKGVTGDQLGEGSNQGYYLIAGDAPALDEIFENISEQISAPSIELDESAALKDFVSDYFTAPIEGSIHVYTADYLGRVNGERQWSEPVELAGAVVTQNTAERSISVKGFDYSGNFVADNNGSPRGKKLIVTLDVNRAPGYIGGNDVETNKSPSGVYDEDDTPVDYFEIPEVDVPLLYDYDPHDHKIYVTERWNDIEKFFDDPAQDGIQYRIGDDIFTLGDKIEGTESKVSDHVTVIYTVTDAKGDVVGIFTALPGERGSWTQLPEIHSENKSEDEIFTISCKVVPASEGSEDTLVIPNKFGKLHVFRPIVICTDTKVFKGESADLTERTVFDSWHCDCENESLPESVPPTLTYVITKVAGKGTAEETVYTPATDSDFTVVVKANGIDISDRSTVIGDTTTEHDNDCILNNAREEHHFTVHVIPGRIEINKTILGDKTRTNAQGDPIFTFKITNLTTGEVLYRSVRFGKKDPESSLNTVPLTMLSKGVYTVEELSSLDYELVSAADNGGSCTGIVSDGTVIFAIGGGSGATDFAAKTGKAAFTNELKPGKVTDSDIVVNKFVYDELTGQYVIKQVTVPRENQSEKIVKRINQDRALLDDDNE